MAAVGAVRALLACGPIDEEPLEKDILQFLSSNVYHGPHLQGPVDAALAVYVAENAQHLPYVLDSCYYTAADTALKVPWRFWSGEVGGCPLGRSWWSRAAVFGCHYLPTFRSSRPVGLLGRSN